LRVAALYDVHGNVHALEAVLAELEHERVGAIVIGGDMAMGPFPAETVARLEELEHAHWIRGNCEREIAVVGTAPASGNDEVDAWCAEALGDETAARLAALPTEVTLEVEGLGTVLFCHATPRRDDERITRLTPEAELVELLDGVDAEVVVVGHTHVQFDRPVGGTRLVNAGSVGWPWEDARGAYWGLLGPEVELRRTAYDAEAAVAAMRATDFPWDGFCESLLVPRGAEATTRRFEEAR
jgi:putative phosphoesterase